MSLKIGIGKNLRIAPSGVTAFWTTREPSGVAATITSPTTATVVWTDSAVLGADGYKVYAGATLKATVAVGVQTAAVTGLTAATEYIFKVVAYKDAQESTGDTDTQTTWNAVFTGITRAWPLTEAGMRRDVMGSGDDFFPVNVTSNADGTVFNGSTTHLACGDGDYRLGIDTSFTLAFTVKPTATAGTLWLMTKGFQSNVNDCEWYMYHNGTQLYFRLNNGATDVTVTDATNRLTAGTATKVVVGFDAVNNKLSMKIANNDPVLVDYNNATKSSLGGIVIGCAATYGSYFNGAIKDLMYWTGTYLTDAQQSTLYGLSFPAAALSAQAATLDPDDLAAADKYSRHDFSDLTTQFTDAAKTTPVASDDDPVRVIESLWGTHDWSAPADAVRPLHKTNILGGLGVGLWNGTDSELNFDAAMPGNADFTLFLLAQNEDDAEGSQILHSSVSSLNYLSFTGAAYGSGCYGVAHCVNGTAVAGGTLANTTGFNLMEVSRGGNLYKALTNGITNNDPTNGIKTIASNMVFNECGPEHSAGWWFNGYLAEVIIVARKLTDAEKARIRAFLTAKWTILNMKYNQV